MNKGRQLSWSEKMERPAIEEIKVLDKPFAGWPEGTRMLISTPRRIGAYLQQLPEGYTMSMASLRKELALAAGADFTCPLTTGIFVRTIAEFTHEQKLQGLPPEQLYPFWRLDLSRVSWRHKLSFSLEEYVD